MEAAIKETVNTSKMYDLTSSLKSLWDKEFEKHLIKDYKLGKFANRVSIDGFEHVFLDIADLMMFISNSSAYKGKSISVYDSPEVIKVDIQNNLFELNDLTTKKQKALNRDVMNLICIYQIALCAIYKEYDCLHIRGLSHQAYKSLDLHEYISLGEGIGYNNINILMRLVYKRCKQMGFINKKFKHLFASENEILSDLLMLLEYINTQYLINDFNEIGYVSQSTVLKIYLSSNEYDLVKLNALLNASNYEYNAVFNNKIVKFAIPNKL